MMHVSCRTFLNGLTLSIGTVGSAEKIIAQLICKTVQNQPKIVSVSSSARQECTPRTDNAGVLFISGRKIIFWSDSFSGVPPKKVKPQKPSFYSHKIHKIACFKYFSCLNVTIWYFYFTGVTCSSQSFSSRRMTNLICFWFSELEMNNVS